MIDAYELVTADCLDAMRSMDGCSVDAIVTDPPYAIQIGPEWDSFGGSNGTETDEERKAKSVEYARQNKGAAHYGNAHGHTPKLDEMIRFQEAMRPVFEEALRVAKPGAHALVFSSPRTMHRMMCAMEEAGWQLRDTLMWVHAQGLPKGQRVDRLMSKTYPEEAGDWVGFNTQLKPSWEPIILARKPLDGTIAHNVHAHGVGGINVDACRVPSEPHDSSLDGEATREKTYDTVLGTSHKPGPRGGDERGRYPANLIHDGSDEVLSFFPDAMGQQGDLSGGIPKRGSVVYGEYGPTTEYKKRVERNKSAARFFFCAKATKSDRNSGGVANDHVSVKPNALMRWLVRLVTPEGGAVMDPFMGSGSTGVACMQEGMRFVGIEMDPHYVDIARARIESAQPGVEQLELPI